MYRFLVFLAALLFLINNAYSHGYTVTTVKESNTLSGNVIQVNNSNQILWAEGDINYNIFFYDPNNTTDPVKNLTNNTLSNLSQNFNNNGDVVWITYDPSVAGDTDPLTHVNSIFLYQAINPGAGNVKLYGSDDIRINSAQINDNGDIAIQATGTTGTDNLFDNEVFLLRVGATTLEQVTFNDFYDGIPTLKNDGNIYWTHSEFDPGPPAQSTHFLNLYESAAATPVATKIIATDPNSADPNKFIHLSGFSVNDSGQIVWSSANGLTSQGEIYLYDPLATPQISKLTDNNYSDSSVTINDRGDITWEGVVDNNSNPEAFIYKAATQTIQRLTDDEDWTHDRAVNSNANGEVVWNRFLNENYEIYQYDMDRNIIHILPDNPAFKNPRSGIINSSGAIAFTATVDDTVDPWVRGIYIAVPDAGPDANAGPEQFAVPGESVAIDGTGSSDLNGNPVLSYFWSVQSFPVGSATLTWTSTASNDIFIPDLPGEYVLSLVVNDGTLDSPADKMTIYVSGPVVNTHNYAWTYTVGGIGYDGANSVVTDSNGNIYYTGYITGSDATADCISVTIGCIDLDPTIGLDLRNTASAGWNDFYVTKLNADGSYAWSKLIGNSGHDWGVAITVDASDNVYVSGRFNGTVDFDPDGSGDTHIAPSQYSFVTKIMADGSYGWTHTSAAGFYNWGRNLDVDALGNVYIAGNFFGTVDFNPEDPTGDSQTSNGGSDGYITMVNADGSYGWTKTFGGSGFYYDMGHATTVDPSGNIYLLGHFQGINVDLNPDAGTAMYSSIVDPVNGIPSVDAFINKFDPDGIYLSTQIIAGPYWDGGYEMESDDLGNIYITGLFRGTTDFDPSTGIDERTSVGQVENIYITKLNADGSYGWTKTFAKQTSAETTGFVNWGNYLTVAGDGSVYAAGCFAVTTDFDSGPGFDFKSPHRSPTALISSRPDVFLTRINSDGSYGWTKTMGGYEYDCATSTSVTANGDVYVTGNFYNDADFNPDSGVVDNHTSAGYSDIFITRFSPIADTDGDGILDNLDKCTLVANPAQTDADGDGFGNMCDADLDNNGIVNIDDYFILATAFFTPDPVADLNVDGIVNIDDYFILATAFFTAPGPSGVAP